MHFKSQGADAWRFVMTRVIQSATDLRIRDVQPRHVQLPATQTRRCSRAQAGEPDGFYADACITVATGRARTADARLIETARRVGARHGAPVVFAVDAAAMRRAGHVFYRSANGVWLTDRVPPEFLGPLRPDDQR